MGKVTIADIAKKTGLSATTISRYLNGKYEAMSESTRNRISNVIRELEYKPSRVARSLRLQQSRMIGVLVSDITSPFSAILFTGVSEWCEANGYTVLLADAGDDPETEKRYIQSMLDQGVDGLIINATGEGVDYLNEVNRTIIPIVLADRPVENCECELIGSDTVGSIKSLVDLIFAKGYDEIVYVTGKIGTNGIRRERHDAFKKYYKELNHVEGLVLEYDADNKELVDNKLSELLADAKANHSRLAVLSANGVVLTQLARWAQRTGLIIGKDFGLCSYDNWSWMDIIGPGITVIEVPTHEIGKECAKALIDRITNGNEIVPKRTDLPCKLVERHSL